MTRGPLVLFLLAGVLVGVAGGYVLGVRNAPPPPPVDCPQPTGDALAKLCEPTTPSQTEQLTLVQAQVETLATALRSKEAELEAAMADAEKATDQKQAAQAKAKALEKEVFGLRGELGKAQLERDQILEELRATVEKLDIQVIATETARAEAATWQARSTDEQWSRFVAETKVEICAKGTAKKIDGCQDAVDAALTDAIKVRFMACLKSAAAIPSIGQLEKGQTLPTFAEAFPEDKRLVEKGWYVLLCDPTLPEAGQEAVPVTP